MEVCGGSPDRNPLAGPDLAGPHASPRLDSLVRSRWWSHSAQHEAPRSQRALGRMVSGTRRRFLLKMTRCPDRLPRYLAGSFPAARSWVGRPERGPSDCLLRRRAHPGSSSPQRATRAAPFRFLVCTKGQDDSRNRGPRRGCWVEPLLLEPVQAAVQMWNLAVGCGVRFPPSRTGHLPPTNHTHPDV